MERNDEYLIEQFCRELDIVGRHFGQTQSPFFGVSDGNQGVQWNLVINRQTGSAQIGVNLEGMKYANKNWPISNFILSELNTSQISAVKNSVVNQDDISFRFTRDAWQYQYRPEIEEKYIGGRVFLLSEMTDEQWRAILIEALGCLDNSKKYKGRASQLVTLVNARDTNIRKKIMHVTPHVTISCPLRHTGDITKDIRLSLSCLKPIYLWLDKTCQ